MTISDREKWDGRYAQMGPAGPAPSWLERVRGHLPAWGNALDVASGSGRIALWLARRGYETAAVDTSEVGLSLLQRSARDQELELETRVLDLQYEPLPQGPFSVIAFFHYLDRELFAAMAAGLTVGGVLLCELHTTANLAYRPHPSRRCLLESGELPGLVAPLRLLQYGEGVYGGDQGLARCVAVKT